MFRFIYASLPNETIDPEAVRACGFEGFEKSGESASQDGLVGIRDVMLTAAVSSIKAATSYAIWKPDGDWVETAAQIDAALATFADGTGQLLIEPWASRRTVRELWQFMETLSSRCVGIAFSAAWGDRNSQPADRVVPTLNLRLGLVRVADEGPTTMDYARRLAGIGFGGFFVIDPPQAGDHGERLATAVSILTRVRSITHPQTGQKQAAKKAP